MFFPAWRGGLSASWFALVGSADGSQDQDAIDLTDNDLSSLGNFPFFPRLRTLLLSRNRINHIQPTLVSSLPNLTVLVLTSNNISELADLEPLRNLTKLTHLTLLENPVTRKEVGLACRHFLLCLEKALEILTDWSSITGTG